MSIQRVGHVENKRAIQLFMIQKKKKKKNNILAQISSPNPET